MERFHWLYLSRQQKDHTDIQDVARSSWENDAGDSASEGRMDEPPQVPFLPVKINTTFQGISSFKVGRGKERHSNF